VFLFCEERVRLARVFVLSAFRCRAYVRTAVTGESSVLL